MPPEARTVVLPGTKGALALVVNSALGCPATLASGKIVAWGVPRVSTLKPRLGWKVLTKSRWSPRSTLFSL